MSQDIQTSKRTAKASLNRTLGERLRQSRELNNMSLSDAAKKLGYANPSALSKIEMAVGTNPPPHMLILACSKLYDVTIDYLYGLEDVMEYASHDESRKMAAFLSEQYEITRRRDMESFAAMHTRITKVESIVQGYAADADELKHAIDRMIEVNGKEWWEEVRGGSRVENSLDRVVKRGREGNAYLQRCTQLIGMACKAGNQYSLFKKVEDPCL